MSIEPTAKASPKPPRERVRVVSQQPTDRKPRSTTVSIGGMRVDRSPNHLVTLLGSCVGAALYDPVERIGGLAHIMLPVANGRVDRVSKFADTAIPALVAAMTRAGAETHRMQAKLAGGARLLNPIAEAGRNDIGLENVLETRRRLADLGIQILSENVGGSRGRKMSVDLRTFDLKIRLLNKSFLRV